MPESWRQTSFSRSRGDTGEARAQDVRDQAADGFGDRRRIRAGLGGVDEDLEGLVAAVLVDGDKGLAQRCADLIGVAAQAARARFLLDRATAASCSVFGSCAVLSLARSASASGCFCLAVALVSSTTFWREPVT